MECISRIVLAFMCTGAIMTTKGLLLQANGELLDETSSQAALVGVDACFHGFGSLLYTWQFDNTTVAPGQILNIGNKQCVAVSSCSPSAGTGLSFADCTKPNNATSPRSACPAATQFKQIKGDYPDEFKLQSQLDTSLCIAAAAPGGTKEPVVLRPCATAPTDSGSESRSPSSSLRAAAAKAPKGGHFGSDSFLPDWAYNSGDGHISLAGATGVPCLAPV